MWRVFGGTGSKMQPQNKELERTRSSHFAAGPRRSIQCYAGYRDRLVPDENEKDSASCVDD